MFVLFTKMFSNWPKQWATDASWYFQKNYKIDAFVVLNPKHYIKVLDFHTHEKNLNYFWSSGLQTISTSFLRVMNQSPNLKKLCPRSNTLKFQDIFISSHKYSWIKFGQAGSKYPNNVSNGSRINPKNKKLVSWIWGTKVQYFLHKINWFNLVEWIPNDLSSTSQSFGINPKKQEIHSSSPRW